MRRTLLLLSAVALIAISVSILSTSAGAGTRPTCFGREANLVGTNHNWHPPRPPHRDDRKGDDHPNPPGPKGDDHPNPPGPHGDNLRGGEGNDVIVAKAGNDNLDGGPGGTDRLCGNTGDDHIHAKGSDKAFVSGGPGHDTCDVDHGDVVVDCEVVHRDTRPDHR